MCDKEGNPPYTFLESRISEIIKTFHPTVAAQYIVELIKNSECVPYQICPKCNGNKYVSNPLDNTSTAPTKPCDICSAAGIIPMHKYIYPTTLVSKS